MAEQDWVWDGHAAHLIVAEQCQFHLATRVGDYIVSTVGEYLPLRPVRVEQREGVDESTYGRFDTVGLDRLFETFVFRASGAGFGAIDDFMEIDSLPANDHTTAVENHMTLCRKYAAPASEPGEGTP